MRIRPESGRPRRSLAGWLDREVPPTCPSTERSASDIPCGRWSRPRSTRCVRSSYPPPRKRISPRRTDGRSFVSASAPMRAGDDGDGAGARGAVRARVELRRQSCPARRPGPFASVLAPEARGQFVSLAGAEPDPRAPEPGDPRTRHTRPAHHGSRARRPVRARRVAKARPRHPPPASRRSPERDRADRSPARVERPCPSHTGNEQCS